MPYTPQQWHNDIISAPYGPISEARLTVIENGVASGYTTFNVKDSAYGAVGNGVADDTAAIQAAINAAAVASGIVGGGVVFFPRGNYLISSALSVPSFVSLIGAGCGQYAGNNSPVTIFQSSPTANGITLADHAISVTLSDFLLAGPLSGSGKGIYLPAASGAPVNLCIRDVTVDSFGGNGVELTNPTVSRLERVTSQNNGGDGFYIHGTAGGTSFTIISCWANTNALTGWHLFNMTYTSLVSTAADGNGRGYYFDSCVGVGLYSCGAESNVAKNSLDGSCFEVSACRTITAVACLTFANAAKGFWVTGSSFAVTLIGFRENGPAVSATASIQIDAGSKVTLINTGDVVTATNVAGGTMDGINHDGFGDWQTTGGMDASNLRTFGGVDVYGAGNGLRVVEGANCKQGTAVLNGTTAVAVATTAVTANSRIFLTINTPGGTPASPYVSARSAGTSFSIKSTGAADTSTVAYEIIEPG